MKIAFTICSNNYLAKAISLYTSIQKTNPDYQFVICLADKLLTNEEYSKYTKDIEIISFMDCGVKDFDTMINNYSIIELNTAIKPYFAEYLFIKNREAEIVIYLDPDIVVYAPFTTLEKSLKINDIVITPHFSTPVNDYIHDFERIVLKVGIYNLGFIAFKRSTNTLSMLRWWQLRLKEECSIDFNSGLFVDQIWINYVPLYFNYVYIDKDPGLNMAYWNFYERTLTMQNDQYYANGGLLVFFHFSGYNPYRPDVLFKGLKYSFEKRPDLISLYNNYRKDLFENGHDYFSKLSTIYDKKEIQRKTIIERIKTRLLSYFTHF